MIENYGLEWPRGHHIYKQDLYQMNDVMISRIDFLLNPGLKELTKLYFS